MIHIKRDKSYYYAVATMAGCVIGLGMFTLPYDASQSGLGIFLLLLTVLASVQYMMHLIYASVVQSLSAEHLLPGYEKYYLGKWAKQLALFLQAISAYISMLAYLIVSATFARLLLAPLVDIPDFVWAAVLASVASLVLWRGIAGLAKAEFWLSFLMLACLIVVVATSFASNSFAPLHYQWLARADAHWLLYGAILFSLSGEAGVPTLVALCRRQSIRIRSAILWGGTIIPFSLYLLLVLAVWGVAGSNVSPDALSTLSSYLPGWAYILALLAGLTAIATTYLAIMSNLRDIYRSDYAFSGFWAWFLAAWPAYLVYISGYHNFIRLVSFSGAVLGGLSGFLLILIYRQANKSRQLSVIISPYVLWVLGLLFGLGIWTGI